MLLFVDLATSGVHLMNTIPHIFFILILIYIEMHEHLFKRKYHIVCLNKKQFVFL